MPTPSPFRLTTLTIASATLLAAGGGDSANPVIPEETRTHDTRSFTADATATTFTAMAAAASDVTDMATTSRWAGVLGAAAYRIEVPANWHGKLVM